MKSTQAGEQLKVRLQTQVHEWIKAQAKEQDRSMNWLVNKFLAQAKESQEARHAEAA
ncbi:toxin-antitoxin system HicB family antitoxin [Paracidovorax wautersii]|uniref:HicB family RNase H-like nuclease n=1 Tax=Paracidovorax wautersii TaxID=1177982 RepID=A0ABU1IG20_9BURK|nr:toxin-antitoxin system HicB family antitoxin [Paracidovorax wautersii]MDR6216160.1 putative HicB family RNase H-like nuclease [Paracidovorax wautersii]